MMLSNAISIWWEKGKSVNTDLNIVCLWDSNTAGSLIVNPADRYSDLFWTNNWITTINSWVWWDTILEVTARLATDLTPHKVVWEKNIATLLIWVNDLKTGATIPLTASEAWTNLQALITAIKTDGWEVWVMTIPIVVWDTTANDKIREYNTLIEWDTSNIVIDIYNEFVSPTDENQAIPWIMFPDNIHFNESWHSIVNTKLYQVLYPIT